MLWLTLSVHVTDDVIYDDFTTAQPQHNHSTNHSTADNYSTKLFLRIVAVVPQGAWRALKLQ